MNFNFKLANRDIDGYASFYKLKILDLLGLLLIMHYFESRLLIYFLHFLIKNKYALLTIGNELCTNSYMNNIIVIESSSIII